MENNINNLDEYIKLSELAKEYGGPQSFLEYIFDSGRLEGVCNGIDYYEPKIAKLVQENKMLQTQVHNRNVALLIIAIAAALGLSVWGLRKLYKKYKAEKESTYRKTTACS